MRSDALNNRIAIIETVSSLLRATGSIPLLDEVAEHAGISRTTFFRHFPDRGSMLEAMLERSIDKLEAAVTGMEQSDTALFDLLALLCEGASTELAFVNYCWDSSQRDEKAGAFLNRALARACSILESPIRRAVQAGLCRPDLTPRDIVLAAPMLSGALRGRTAEEREILVARVISLLTEGIRKR